MQATGDGYTSPRLASAQQTVAPVDKSAEGIRDRGFARAVSRLNADFFVASHGAGMFGGVTILVYFWKHLSSHCIIKPVYFLVCPIERIFDTRNSWSVHVCSDVTEGNDKEVIEYVDA